MQKWYEIFENITKRVHQEGVFSDGTVTDVDLVYQVWDALVYS